jgi:hypothetical protein
MDPLTGELFGEGGVEKSWHLPTGLYSESAKGDVIMPKLKNETAK